MRSSWSLQLCEYPLSGPHWGLTFWIAEVACFANVVGAHLLAIDLLGTCALDMRLQDTDNAARDVINATTNGNITRAHSKTNWYRVAWR